MLNKADIVYYHIILFVCGKIQEKNIKSNQNCKIKGGKKMYNDIIFGNHSARVHSTSVAQVQLLSLLRINTNTPLAVTITGGRHGHPELALFCKSARINIVSSSDNEI